MCNPKEDSIYMMRCMELARLGMPYAKPNPMVGSVLVHQGKIISEGWHQYYGGPHAEINCLNKLAEKDRSVLSESTLYVNLEPCAHHGKTPPCAQRIVEEKIQRVVIANKDPFAKVQGKGIELMRQAGIEVVENMASDAGLWLNRRFLCMHQQQRPYIILKWAQTHSGFFATTDRKRLQISNAASQRLVHKWRMEESAIMVGTDTALYDNPSLTVRYWDGPQPLKIILDRYLRLPQTLSVFQSDTPVWVVNVQKEAQEGNIHYIQVPEENLLPQLMKRLYAADVMSLFVEGGSTLLQRFIEEKLWDEARVLYAPHNMDKGIAAPQLLDAQMFMETILSNNMLRCYMPNRTAYPYVPGMEL
jgi:diaminohydroxyphosphoribosylaminopyrimidine deaminase/5-amino-6-(5-phosphoribosylamino)uracil reductase